MACPFYGGAVAAETIGQESCDAADGGDADAGQVVNLALGQVLLEVLDDLPAIDEGLEFRWRAEVLEEITTLGPGLQADYGREQRVFGALLLTFGFVAIGFHVESMY